MGTFLVALLLVDVLILIHETGHLLAALGLGVEVNEFAVGIGPTLAHHTPAAGRLAGIRFSLRALPVGGFLRMEEEVRRAEDAPPGPSSPARHAAVALAGPVASAMAVVGFFLVAHLVWGAPPRPELDGFTEYDAARFTPSAAVAIQATAGTDIHVKRTPEDVRAGSKPRSIVAPGVPWERIGPRAAVSMSVKTSAQIGALMAEVFYWAVREPAMVARGIGGPLGIVEEGATLVRGPEVTPPPKPDTGTGDPTGTVSPATRGDATPAGAPETEPAATPDPGWRAATRGYGLLFLYAGTVSGFLVLLNLIPLPPFDGFQVVVGVGEAVTGRRLPRKARAALAAIGIVMVVALLVWGTINDLERWG